MSRMSKDDIIEMVLGDRILDIEKTTRSFCESLNLSEDKHKLALAALAYRLARKLDRDAGMATAAIAKELRETLATIADAGNNDDSFWEHFNDPNFSVPSPLRNT